jgi:hypothetical protein
MKNLNSEAMIEKTCIRHGLLTAGALVTFFLLMRVIGFAENVELRFLNLAILMGGILFSFRSLKKEWQGPLGYLQGLSCGTFTTVIAVSAFALFMFIYLMFVDRGFMQMLKAEHGRYLNPYTSALALFIEGAFSGIIVSFSLMQYLKDSILPSVIENENEVMPAAFSYAHR